MKAVLKEREQAACVTCRRPWADHLTKSGALLKRYVDTKHRPTNPNLLVAALFGRKAADDQANK